MRIIAAQRQASLLSISRGKIHHCCHHHLDILHRRKLRASYSWRLAAACGLHRSYCGRSASHAPRNALVIAASLMSRIITSGLKPSRPKCMAASAKKRRVAALASCAHRMLFATCRLPCYWHHRPSDALIIIARLCLVNKERNLAKVSCAIAGDGTQFNGVSIKIRRRPNLPMPSLLAVRNLLS